MIVGAVKMLVMLVAMIGLVVATGGVIVWTGAYNVAATEPHYAMTTSLFTTARDRAVSAHANGITPPPGWPKSVDLKKGFRNYHEMCVVCHAAPGVKDSVIRKGLNPEPPKLTEDQVQRRPDGELFWIIKHGIKMSGMPAFGPTHTEKELWEVAAFLRRVASMQPTEYHDLLEQSDLPSQVVPSPHDHRSKGLQ
ncbi:MAG: cytochrome c [Nitrospira sp.]